MRLDVGTGSESTLQLILAGYHYTNFLLYKTGMLDASEVLKTKTRVLWMFLKHSPTALQTQPGCGEDEIG